MARHDKAPDKDDQADADEESTTAAAAGKAGKSGKSGKSAKADAPNKKDKAEKSAEDGKTEKPKKAEKAEKAAKAEKAEEAAKVDEADDSKKTDKAAKASKPAKSEKADMADQDGKAKKTDKAAKADKADADADALDSDDAPQRDSDADAFWEKVGVEPVEIAMPKGVGLTLRAYRMSDVVDEEEDEDVEKAEADEKPAEPEDSEEQDEDEEDEKPAKKGKKGKKKKQGKKPAAEAEPEEDTVPTFEDPDAEEPPPEAFDDEIEEDEDDEDAEKVIELEPEEIPVFLTHRGKLPLFESAEALVAYVKSGKPNDLTVIDTWDELVDDIKPEYVVPAEADAYGLDLVVKNLRGGHDTWDPELVIGAGELARDLGYALRQESIMSSLSAGSPLDKLDNAMRDLSEGPIRRMLARRKLRKVGTQQTALAWRGIINKINEAVDWRK